MNIELIATLFEKFMKLSQAKDLLFSEFGNLAKLSDPVKQALTIIHDHTTSLATDVLSAISDLKTEYETIKTDVKEIVHPATAPTAPASSAAAPNASSGAKMI